MTPAYDVVSSQKMAPLRAPSSSTNTIPIFSIPRRAAVCRKIVIDIIVLFSLILVVVLFYKRGKPYRRGFHCNDASIRYPYRENTISSGVNWLYSILIPCATMLINELIILQTHINSATTSSSITASSGSTSSSSSSSAAAHTWWIWSSWSRHRRFLSHYLWLAYLQLIPFWFSIAITLVVTDIWKYGIGRLRPHFLDLCRPQLPSGVVITRFSGCSNPFTYETDYHCSNYGAIDAWRAKDMHMSFLSGHASLAAVALVYATIYVQCRLTAHGLSALIKPLFQASMLVLALYTGATRISDYKHHWSDVVCGLALGVIVAILVARFVSHLPAAAAADLQRQIEIDDCDQQNPLQQKQTKNISKANGNGYQQESGV